MKALAKTTETNRQYLISKGWEFKTSRRARYGTLYYWEHPAHQKIDGMWYTQGDAVAYQKHLDKLQRGLDRMKR